MCPRFHYQDPNACAQQQQRRRSEGQQILARSRETSVQASKPSLEEQILNRNALQALSFSTAIPSVLPHHINTRDGIAKQSVIFDFKKLTTLDLVCIFISKLDASLKCLRIFDNIKANKKDNIEHYNNMQKLIERLKHYKKGLEELSIVRTKEELQSWNFGLHKIGKISFVGFRKNHQKIIKYLSGIWNSNYFEYW